MFDPDAGAIATTSLTAPIFFSVRYQSDRHSVAMRNGRVASFAHHPLICKKSPDKALWLAKGRFVRSLVVQSTVINLVYI